MVFPFIGRCQLLGVAMSWRRRRQAMATPSNWERHNIRFPRRGGVGWGGVKIIISNDTLGHAHSHPPSHNIGKILDGDSLATSKITLGEHPKYLFWDGWDLGLYWTAEMVLAVVLEMVLG